MSSKLETYSVVIAWDDNDSEQGTWGGTVKATNHTEAEARARDEMRACHLENYPPAEGETEEEACEGYTHQTIYGPVFGGSAVEVTHGAIWKAAELESALRNVLAIMGMPDRMTRAETAEARKLLDEIDNIGAN